MEENRKSNPYDSPQYRSQYSAGPMYEGTAEDSFFDSPFTAGANQEAFSDAKLDERVGYILTKSFCYMFIALCLSAIAAEVVYYCIRTGAISIVSIYMAYTPSLFIEIGLVLFGNHCLAKGNVKLAGLLLAAYSIVNGITFSLILFRYGGGLVTSAFVSTALVFGIMAVIGIVSKKDFGMWGRIGIMLVSGVVVLTTLNIFILKSSSFDMTVSVVGVIAFIILTAVDTQKIKKMAMMYAAEENTDRVIAMSGALMLYLDFVNIFLYILKFTGKRSRK